MNGTFRRVSRVAVMAAVVLPFASCATTPPTAGDDAIMCPKCETVWIQRPDPGDVYGLTYRSEQSMRCPDCEDAVAGFFKTGRFEHTCSTCGDEFIHCKLHR